MRRLLIILLALVLLPHASARADDYGPHRDLRDVTYAAKRLLAHRLRDRKIDPLTVTIKDVVVVKNQALASWVATTQKGVIGLMRYANRWWDAFDEAQPPQCPSATSAFPAKPFAVFDYDAPLDPVSVGFDAGFAATAREHNAAFALLQSKTASSCNDSTYRLGPDLFATGGLLSRQRSETAGYEIIFKYATSTMPSGAKLELRARAPSPAEILDYPSPPHGSSGSTGVLFLYFDLNSKAPVSFAKGGKFEVWVPWVMDDSLRYELELYEGPTVVGPVKASIFDNVLHFDLPPFSLLPGETLAEIDGYW